MKIAQEEALGVRVDWGCDQANFGDISLISP